MPTKPQTCEVRSRLSAEVVLAAQRTYKTDAGALNQLERGAMVVRMVVNLGRRRFRARHGHCEEVGEAGVAEPGSVEAATSVTQSMTAVATSVGRSTWSQ